MSSARFDRGIVATLALLFVLALPAAAHATTVRLMTTLGAIDIVLHDAAAPQTVANFLAYVNGGAYRNSFIHRSVPGFVIQGGGFVWDDATSNVVAVPAKAPVVNEFSSSRSNLRGTIAMAKLGGNPNSATSQWFINLADNSANLDGQNGGFTVFGEVTAGSMAVADAIAALQRVNAGSPFDSLPIIGTIGGVIQKSNLVIVSAATAVSANYQGLWWNANESGWGMSVTQHGDIIFVAIYTYDAAGQPIWYAITNCPVTATGCTGDIYRVNGGTAPTAFWNGAGRVLTKVGTGTLEFADANAGTFNFTIDDVAGSKAITRQVFATGTVEPAVDYTDLWWNQNESGWGVSLTQQFGTTIFAAWYAYDPAGNPVWYVATNCPVSGEGCTGDLYRVTGGAPLTAAWKPVNPATRVGNVTFDFADAVTGTMSYSIDGVAASRHITRQVY